MLTAAEHRTDHDAETIASHHDTYPAGALPLCGEVSDHGQCDGHHTGGEGATQEARDDNPGHASEKQIGEVGDHQGNESGKMNDLEPMRSAEEPSKGANTS